MFTFLPREYKAEVEREYRKRLLFVVWSLFFVLMLSAAALALPSYFTMNARENSAQISFKSALSPAPETIDLEAQVKDVQAKAVLLNTTFNQKLLSSVMEQIALRINQPGISITNVALKRGGERGSITLSGIAKTRDALVSFSKVLSADVSFKNVSLPVSALAKNKDIPFSFSINSTF